MKFQLKWVRQVLGRQFLFPLGVLAFSLLYFGNELSASAGTEMLTPATTGLLASSSWSSNDSRPSRSIYPRDSLSGEISPFSPGSNNISLDLGQVFLMGDLSKFQNNLGTQLHYNYGVSDLFSFDSSLGYSQHSNGLFSLMTLLSGVRMNLSWYDKIIPYAVFGLGFYLPSYTDTTAAAGSGSNPSGPSSTAGGANAASLPSVSALLFGVHFGPGIDLALSKNVFFGASLVFHEMFGTTQPLSNGSLLSLGGTYTTFYLHVGGTF